MKYDTAYDFFTSYLKLANRDKAHINMPNPAVSFTTEAYMGKFDAIPDLEYESRLDDTKEISSFWDCQRSQEAGYILLNAIARTDLCDSHIHSIAKILADAATITDYIAEKEACGEYAFQPGSNFPPAYGMKNPISSPHEIYDYLNKNIYGQDAAKRAVSMLMYHHLHGNSRNIVMAGKSGCGKTEIWRALSKRYGFIRIINGPQLSCDGWKGSFHLKDIFWDEPKEMVEHLVIVIDEADKMFEPAIASGGTDVAKMVQNELLKLMDGDTLTFVSDNNNDKSRKITVDCSGVSVVLCGSFETMLQTKIEASSGGIGFMKSAKNESRVAECNEGDLIKYGNVRREIAGRINQIVTLDALTAADFEAILDSRISPILKLEKAHKVSLSLDGDSRKRLAAEAAQSGLGCRFLRSKLQSMLDGEMFDTPDAKEYSLHYN